MQPARWLWNSGSAAPMHSGSQPPPPSSRARPLHPVRLAGPPVPHIVKTANGVKHGSRGGPCRGRRTGNHADFDCERLASTEPVARQPDHLLHHPVPRPLADSPAWHICRTRRRSRGVVSGAGADSRTLSLAITGQVTDQRANTSRKTWERSPFSCYSYCMISPIRGDFTGFRVQVPRTR